MPAGPLQVFTKFSPFPGDKEQRRRARRELRSLLCGYQTRARWHLRGSVDTATAEHNVVSGGKVIVFRNM